MNVAGKIGLLGLTALTLNAENLKYDTVVLEKPKATIKGTLGKEFYSVDMRPSGFRVEDTPAGGTTLGLSYGNASTVLWSDYTKNGFREVDITQKFGGTFTNVFDGALSLGVRGDFWAYPTDHISPGRRSDILVGVEADYTHNRFGIGLKAFQLFENDNHSEGNMFAASLSYTLPLGSAGRWKFSASPVIDLVGVRDFYTPHQTGFAHMTQGLRLSAESGKLGISIGMHNQTSFQPDKPDVLYFKLGAEVKF